MSWHVEIESVHLAAGTALGLRIGNPQHPEKAMVIVLIGQKGMIVCRNFDIAALEQRGVAAARVQGVTSFADALNAPIESCTAQARQAGVTEGMRGEDALTKLL